MRPLTARLERFKVLVRDYQATFPRVEAALAAWDELADADKRLEAGPQRATVNRRHRGLDPEGLEIGEAGEDRVAVVEHLVVGHIVKRRSAAAARHRKSGPGAAPRKRPRGTSAT